MKPSREAWRAGGKIDGGKLLLNAVHSAQHDGDGSTCRVPRGRRWLEGGRPAGEAPGVEIPLAPMPGALGVRVGIGAYHFEAPFPVRIGRAYGESLTGNPHGYNNVIELWTGDEPCAGSAPSSGRRIKTSCLIFRI